MPPATGCAPRTECGSWCRPATIRSISLMLTPAIAAAGVAPAAAAGGLAPVAPVTLSFAMPMATSPQSR